MLGTMGILGRILAAIGLYGVLLYSISGRIREIGVRIALGATSLDVLRVIGRQGLVLVASGMTVGLILAFWVTRPLTLFLVPGLSAFDPSAFVAAVFGVWFSGIYEEWMTGTQALILGAAVAVAAPLGDLFESYLKRDAGTKDTGRLFGPHGGALDRLDAAMFAMVAGFYVWHAML